jgi:hypothetical protein
MWRIVGAGCGARWLQKGTDLRSHVTWHGVSAKAGRIARFEINEKFNSIVGTQSYLLF